MHAPPQLTLEEADIILGVLYKSDADEYDLAALASKLKRHFGKYEGYKAIGHMPGIRKADGENLYYIDDREAVTEALRYLVSLRAPREFSPLQTAISSLALMIGGNRRHVCDDGEGRIYELFPEDIAILAHAFTVYNADQRKKETTDA